MALDLFKDMKETGAIPDAVTYSTLINGCIQSRDLSPIFSLVSDSLDCGIQLSKETYSEICKNLTAEKASQIQ
jgi:pentatricopeptide repeat protein